MKMSRFLSFAMVSLALFSASVLAHDGPPPGDPDRVLTHAEWAATHEIQPCTETPAVPATPLRIDRLERLASYLESGRVAPQRFQMSQWGSTTNANDPDFYGCAAGHATAIFASDGFRFTGHQTIGYQNESNLRACQAFFGLEYVEAEHLFGGGVQTPATEAFEIRKVIGRHKIKTKIRAVLTASR